jgi:alpha-beta hydrolase superfamily lysophospholipase
VRLELLLPLTALLASPGCAAPPTVCDDPDTLPVRSAGLDVLVSAPDEDPRGTVVLFHGLGESACTWVDRIEGQRLGERLRAEGWLVVAPDSGPGRADWRTTWPSNADIGSVDDALTHLDHPLLDLDAPIVALGHSNGGTFAPIWAAGSALGPRAAVVANGWGSEALSERAAPPPLLFILAVNDQIVPPDLTRTARTRAQDAGHETEEIENRPQPVVWSRFTRIPGVDEAGSRALFEALEAAELLDADDVLTDNPRLDRRWEDAIPPSLVEHRDAIEEQLHVLYAEHRFSSDNAERIVRFLDGAVGAD